ncbi:hypothetical protein ACIRU3_42095 [Streptomyces sp. NPDC101151]|uniref:hypothetical protein n=1 Tax=Streptomyces sp. NPDC101151 TaxID=3366115 RepID=UPI0038065DA5
MRKPRSAALGRPLLAALTLLGSSALTVLPATSAHAADGFTTPTYCVKTSTIDNCYTSFTSAVSAATNNIVNDAPATMPATYTSSWSTLRTRMEQANSSLSGILFSDVNNTGKGVAIFAQGGCQAATNPNYDPAWNNFLINGEHQKLYTYAGVNLNTVMGARFDNKVNSVLGLNKCAIGLATDPNHTGSVWPAAGYWSNVPFSASNGATSIRFFHSPTFEEASKACDYAAQAKREGWAPNFPQLAVCKFYPGTKQVVLSDTRIDGGAQGNCTLDNAQRTVWIDQSVTNSESFQTEAGQTVKMELGFGDLKTGLELSMKETWGRTWATTSRVATQDVMTVRPGYKGWATLRPSIERYTVTTGVTYPDGGPQQNVQYKMDFNTPSTEMNTQEVGLVTALMTDADRTRMC